MITNCLLAIGLIEGVPKTYIVKENFCLHKNNVSVCSDLNGVNYTILLLGKDMQHT